MLPYCPKEFSRKYRTHCKTFLICFRIFYFLFRVGWHKAINMAGPSSAMAPAEAGQRQTKPQQQRLIKEAYTAVDMAIAAGAAA